MPSRPKSKRSTPLPVVIKDHKQVATRPVMLLVLGPHRSGTSLTARMLECLGAENSRNLNPPNFANPTGYFEDSDIYQFNDNILLPKLQQSWASVSSPDYTRLSKAERSRLGLQALGILRRNYSLANPLSVLKEPRINNTLPFWLSLLEHMGFDVRIVCVVRDPVSTARSLAQRDNFSLAHGGMIYLSAWLSVLPHLQERQVSFVQFDEIFTTPGKVLGKVADKLGLPLPSDFDQRLHAFTSTHLDLALRHSTLPREDVMLEPDLPPLVTELYRVLLEAAQSQNVRKTAKFLAYAERQVGSIAPLLADYDAKQTRLTCLQKKSDASTAECNRFQPEADVSAQQNHAALVAERDALAARASSLECEHSDLVTRHSAIDTALQQLQGQHSALLSERAGLVNELQALAREKEQCAKHAAELEHVRRQTAAERDAINNKLAALQTERGELAARISTLESANSDLVTRHTSLVAERDALATRVTALESELTDGSYELQTKLLAEQNSLVRAIKERDEAAFEQDKLAAKLIKLEREHHALAKSERSLKISHHKLEDRLARANAALALLKNAQDETTSLRSFLASLRAEKDKVAQDRDRLSARVSSLESEHSDLVTRHSSFVKALEELQGQQSSLMAKRDDCTTELEKKAERIHELEEDIQGRFKELAELTKRLISLEDSQQQTAAERDELVTRHSTLVVENKELTRSLETSFQELATISKRLVNAEDDLLKAQLMRRDFGPGDFAIHRCTLENVDTAEPHLSLNLLLEGVESPSRRLERVEFRLVQHHAKVGFALLTSEDEEPPLTSWIRNTQEGPQSVMLVIPQDRSGLKQLRQLSQTDLCFVMTALSAAERTLRCYISNNNLTKRWHPAILGPWLERAVKLRAIIQAKAKLRV